MQQYIHRYLNICCFSQKRKEKKENMNVALGAMAHVGYSDILIHDILSYFIYRN